MFLVIEIRQIGLEATNREKRKGSMGPHDGLMARLLASTLILERTFDTIKALFTSKRQRLCSTQQNIHPFLSATIPTDFSSIC
jgi:hypothetical protein